MSIKRETPSPRGRVPSETAWTISGARNASESDMRADRSLMSSLVTISAMSGDLPDMISSSHRRPLAMAARSFVLASARIGSAPIAAPLDGRINSRLRRKGRGDQGIETTLAGRPALCWNRTSIDRALRVTRSIAATTVSARLIAPLSRSEFGSSSNSVLEGNSVRVVSASASVAARTNRSTA
jgi:hypothetical protein